MWTKFWDMCSGGWQKTEWAIIYIELPEDEATKCFIKLFGCDPNDATCSCCGSDYSISEVDKAPTESSDILIVCKENIKHLLT